MTWREKTVVRVLLLVASIVGNDLTLADELRKLDNHIRSAPADHDAATLWPVRGEVDR